MPQLLHNSFDESTLIQKRVQSFSGNTESANICALKSKPFIEYLNDIDSCDSKIFFHSESFPREKIVSVKVSFSLSSLN